MNSTTDKTIPRAIRRKIYTKSNLINNATEQLTTALGVANHMRLRKGFEDFISTLPNVSIERFLGLLACLPDETPKANATVCNQCYDKKIASILQNITTSLLQNRDNLCQQRF